MNLFNNELYRILPSSLLYGECIDPEPRSSVGEGLGSRLWGVL